MRSPVRLRPFDDRTHVFAFPSGALRPGHDNVLSVLVENMGHNEDFNATDSHKEPRGLTGAMLTGAAGPGWTATTLPHRDTTPGVRWYRTTFGLRLPEDQDVPLGVTFTDDASHHYRALLFVNGWQLGRYINDVGPQHTFPIPPGILRADGRNTIAIAVWNEDGTTGGLGQVTLRRYANLATSLRVSAVPGR